MHASNNKSYYLVREQQAREHAEAARDRGIKAIHEEMAARYHGLAIAAEFHEREDPRQMVRS